MSKKKCGICKKIIEEWDANICIDCRKKMFVDIEKNDSQIGLRA